MNGWFYNLGSIKLFSTKDNRYVHEFKNLFENYINCVRLSSNNNYIICSYIGGDYLKCLDLRMNKILVTLEDKSN